MIPTRGSDAYELLLKQQLFFFGVWDDSSEIGHYTKFLGQVISVAVVVFYGELYVISFPFVLLFHRHLRPIRRLQNVLFYFVNTIF